MDSRLRRECNLIIWGAIGASALFMVGFGWLCL